MSTDDIYGCDKCPRENPSEARGISESKTAGEKTLSSHWRAKAGVKGDDMMARCFNTMLEDVSRHD